MSTLRPFVDYYRDNGISPVRQDLSDLGRHLERRESLYLALGIVPLFVTGRSVIEFGPGSGHNAIYTSRLRPKRYVLVDGNPTGLRAARELLDRHAPEPDACVMTESLIEAYRSDERFDLVLCEGTVPGQRDPHAFVRHVADFVADGGLLVVTTQDAASCLAELLRRIVAAQLVPRTLPVAEQLARLVPVFSPHLATLRGMSRPAEDWILDNVIQPYVGRLFPLLDAIETLRGDGFEPYNASPRFFTVWEWYKRQVGVDRDITPSVALAYHAALVDLIDYRLAGSVVHPPDLGERLLTRCGELYAAMQRAEAGEGYAPSLALVQAIADDLRPHSVATAAALDEALAWCAAASHGEALPPAPAFAGFFGHGQQYLSLVRRGRPA